MSTKADIQRKNGLIKVDVIHLGPKEIRQNLKTALLGTFGETKQHVIEVRELAATVSHPCLTDKNRSGEKQILFRVLGRTTQFPVHVVPGSVDFGYLHLGEHVEATAANPNAASSNNGMVIRVPEDEFTMYIPEVYSFQDLLFRMQKKCRRISSVLDRVGWDSGLGNLLAHRDGRVPGGVGDPGHGVTNPILEEEEEKVNQIDMLEFHVRSSGNCEFKGTGEFWNSFVIWCSPFMRELTGFEELNMFTNLAGVPTYGEPGGIDGADEFLDGTLAPLGRFGRLSPKSLFSTFDERRDILVTSDLPLPIERYVKNGQDLHRFVFGFFDLRGKHDLKSRREVSNLRMTEKWAFSGPNSSGRMIMDPPSATGFASLVLPSTVPSFNIRIALRRKLWDFDSSTYSEVEVPLLKHDSDSLILRMVFTAQV